MLSNGESKVNGSRLLKRALPFLMGLVFAAVGGWILASALGLAPIGRVLVPNYILGVVGAVFFGAGLLLLKVAFARAPTAVEAGAARLLRSEEDKGGIALVWVFTGFCWAFAGIADWILLSGHEFDWRRLSMILRHRRGAFSVAPR